MPPNDSASNGKKPPFIGSQRSLDLRQDEFKGKNEEEIKAYRRHRDAMEQSYDFVRPQWDKALRLQGLYHGVLPKELDVTHSKIMLPIATSIVENEIPRTAASVLSDSDYFDLEAQLPELEFEADAAKQWLLYQSRTRNRIFPRIIPTLKGVAIQGTAFRMISHTVIPRFSTERKPTEWFAGVPRKFQEVQSSTDELAIVSQALDFFNVLPSPNGSAINPIDPESVEAVQYMNVVDWMSEDKIKAMAGKNGANREEIGRMLEKPPSADGPAHRIDQEYRNKRAEQMGFSTPDAIEDVRKGRFPALDKKYRVVWSFFRNQWMAVGEDRYMLYLGPPLIDMIPVAAYTDNPSGTSIYGGPGLLELSEDIILAYLVNYGLRLDYLAGVMHPAKGIREDLIDMNPGHDWDPAPYSTFTYNRNIRDIREALWYDRMPEVTPQAFLEEQGFQQKLQEFTGQPNYNKGLGGQGTLANETATGIVSLIEEGTARSSMRALNIEYTGLQDELKLYMKWGEKYVGEYADIRVREADGFPWTQVDHRAITSQYGIELKGTRGLVHKNLLSQRMVSILPMIIGVLNNPAPGAIEVLDQSLKKMDVDLNLKRILGAAGINTAQAVEAATAPQGQGAPTLQNQGQAVGGAIPQAAAQIGA